MKHSEKIKVDQNIRELGGEVTKKTWKTFSFHTKNRNECSTQAVLKQFKSSFTSISAQTHKISFPPLRMDLFSLFVDRMREGRSWKCEMVRQEYMNSRSTMVRGRSRNFTNATPPPAYLPVSSPTIRLPAPGLISLTPHDPNSNSMSWDFANKYEC